MRKVSAWIFFLIPFSLLLLGADQCKLEDMKPAGTYFVTIFPSAPKRVKVGQEISFFANATDMKSMPTNDFVWGVEGEIGDTTGGWFKATKPGRGRVVVYVRGSRDYASCEVEVYE
jgi:hypothetical protein